MSVLETAKGLGEVRHAALKAAGIFDDGDLIGFFPKDYNDWSRERLISDCEPGAKCVVRVRLASGPSQIRVHGKYITRAVLKDASGSVRAVWFNQPWMLTNLRGRGEMRLFGSFEMGKSGLQLMNPVFANETGIFPVYRKIESVPDKLLRQLIGYAFDAYKPEEIFSFEFRNRFALMEKGEAVRELHYPQNPERLNAARYRMAFERLLVFQLAVKQFRVRDIDGVQIDYPAECLSEFESTLPFPLTGAQKRVLGEILADMKSPIAMARLVQGDVGCGKTAVAFAAAYACVKAGWQCAMMAPTEILAQQHYESAKEILGALGVECGLLMGSMTKKQHDIVKQKIVSGELRLAFGTHALLTSDVEFKNLGLAITDEQHRFGVRQRTALSEKGEHVNVLVMSATPIPRTLSLIIYGDLDISAIDELPPGRKPVKTRIVHEDKRADMYDFIYTEVQKGHQAYFVCPLVEDSEAIEARSAEQLYGELAQSKLNELGIALVHGKLRPDEKDRLLEGFRSGETKILVATTVIEVGINVPSATVMVIENAERFGLAQLHQLRGRVGRGSDEAWCFLMAQSSQKLGILTKSNDGFVIAQKDMELRGPGDIFGVRQSGNMTVNAQEDVKLLELTSHAAADIMNTDTAEAEALREYSKAQLQGRTGIVLSAN